ncbi:hypothetical protein [Proteiniphilum sp. X52]|nr:hypothetical protein [Proteiniphilum sp. X52]
MLSFPNRQDEKMIFNGPHSIGLIAGRGAMLGSTPLREEEISD